MSDEGKVFLERWHKIVAQKDEAGLNEILAEDITMGAPPYWTKLETKPVVARLLGIIVNTIEDFTYHREWIDGRELALEFTGRIGDNKLQGIDLITLNGDGEVQNLDVMIRPMNSLTKLAATVQKKMMEAA